MSGRTADELRTGVSGVSGTRRLSNLVAYVFARQEPNAPTPPPPQQLVDVADKTLYFATIGGLAHGMMQYLYERRDTSGALLDGSGGNRLYDQKKNAFQRISHAMLRGVLRSGSLAVLYFTTELAVAVYRDEYSVNTYYNTLCGGMAAGGILGAVGQTVQRVPVMLKGGVFGTALGGLLGFPVGILQDYLIEQLPEAERARRGMAIAQMRVIADGKMDAVKGREFAMEMERQERREIGENVGRVDLENVIRGIERSAEERQRRLGAVDGHGQVSPSFWKFWKR